MAERVSRQTGGGRADISKDSHTPSQLLEYCTTKNGKQRRDKVWREEGKKRRERETGQREIIIPFNTTFSPLENKHLVRFLMFSKLKLVL